MGNRHLSVLMLYVRGAIVPLFGIMVLMTAVQTGLFWWAILDGAASLNEVVASAWWRAVWTAAVILLFLAMARMQDGGYLVRRLCITERAVFFWHSLSCFLCFLLLWLTEVITVTLLCRYFVTLPAAEHWSGQALFLAFYSNDFLHSLLPLEEVSRWGFLLLSFAMLSLIAADSVARMRYNSKISLLLSIVLMVLWFFQRPVGSITSDVCLMMGYLVIMVYILWDVKNFEEVVADETI